MDLSVKNIDGNGMICLKPSVKGCIDEDLQFEICMDIKEALDLAADIKHLVDKVIEEKNSIVIVPKAVKTMIECGKVSCLCYNHMQHNNDSGMELYRIYVTFFDGAQRSYFHECKFSSDERIFEAQMDYVNHIPIYVDCNHGCPNLLVDRVGRKGYNLTDATGIVGSDGSIVQTITIRRDEANTERVGDEKCGSVQ